MTRERLGVMDWRKILAFLLSFCLIPAFLRRGSIVSGNPEGDALSNLKSNLLDPNNVLQSWDATLVNPCTWFHVTCDSENSVTRVDLGNANLTGRLVPDLGRLEKLQYLELYSNNISGTIPSELGNLTRLVSLDLYQNQLSGNIPVSLGNLQQLRFLDFSNNFLQGTVPINGSFSLFTELSFLNNSGLKYAPTPPPAPISPTASSSEGSSTIGAIAGGVAAGAAILFAAPAILLAWWRRRKPQVHFFDVPAEEDPEVHLGQLKKFSLRELQVATDHFSNKNILGRGGFGKVYRGRLADGSLVAVKRLKEERSQGGEMQFQTEVEMISMAVHRNLLRLRGFCMTPTERLLVYPYMENGSVASRLRDRPESVPPLDWPRAFDLARLANDDDVMLLDWVKGLLKEKKYEILVDADLQGMYEEDQVEQLIQVALLCTQGTPMERPRMAEVVGMLEGEGLAEKWEEWQKEEMFRADYSQAPHPIGWNIPDSTPNLQDEVLSGPR
nr:hypothetical protein DCAR_021841 [Ipomoea trifida]